jgi:hypothetical protein
VTASASEQALIDQGDKWLAVATQDTADGDENGAGAYAATLACAYFLRAGIVARQEAFMRARSESQQIADAIRRRQAAQQEGPADDHNHD